MCTLIVLHRCVPGRPLVVAANRDEFLARPAEAPAIRNRPGGLVLAPLDLEAGGTWAGLSDTGVFVGLTNLRPEVPGPDPGLAVATVIVAANGTGTEKDPEAILDSAGPGKPNVRSRGEVVMTALDAPTAAEAARWARGLEEDAYNPFQLLIADAEQAWLIVYRGRPQLKELEPGIHVVGNYVVRDSVVRDSVVSDGEDDRMSTVLGRPVSAELPVEQVGASAFESEEPRAKKLTRIRERVEKVLTQRSDDLLGDLAAVCREHVDADPFESTCVHVGGRYGTRSSLLLEVARDASLSRFLVCEGPPCEAAFEDQTELLTRLLPLP